MFKITLMVTMVLAGLVINVPFAHSHCQVPCGIYGDGARVKQMLEDHRTIVKAVASIKALNQKKDLKSKHQLIRWVITKEQHAERIIRTVSDYFMAQKIKPPNKGSDHSSYLKILAKHHAVMVAAMNCKQNNSKYENAALLKAIMAIKPHWTSK